MHGILILGHGLFASGLNSTIELVCGKYDFLKSIDFTQDKTPETLKTEIECVIKDWGNKEKIYIFTDLLGGTPFNKSCELRILNEKIEIIAGANIPMLIETCMNINLGIDLDVESIKNIGKDSIESFSVCTKSDTIEDLETDGI